MVTASYLKFENGGDTMHQKYSNHISMASLKRNECERERLIVIFGTRHIHQTCRKIINKPSSNNGGAVDNSKANTQLIRHSQRKRWSITESQLLTLIYLIIQWYSTVTVSKQTPCLDTVS